MTHEEAVYWIENFNAYASAYFVYSWSNIFAVIQIWKGIHKDKKNNVQVFE